MDARGQKDRSAETVLGLKPPLRKDRQPEPPAGEGALAMRLRKHRILPERAEVMRDFACLLSATVMRTYPGIETQVSGTGGKRVCEDHFLWSYGQVLGKFDLAGFDFYHNEPLFRFFDDFFREFFYLREIRTIDATYWHHQLNPSALEGTLEWEEFAYLYGCFNTSFETDWMDTLCTSPALRTEKNIDT